MARMKIGSGRQSKVKFGGGSSDPMESMAKFMGIQMLKGQMEKQDIEDKKEALPPGTRLTETKIDGGSYVTPAKQELEQQKKIMDMTTEDLVKQQSAQRNTDRTAGLIMDAGGRLADWWAKSHQEGGAGSRIRSLISGASQWAGQDYFSETAALPGSTTEIITKMMPLLTQQGEKPGSVRLVQSVFEKIGASLPKTHTGIRSARRELEATLKNMAGFSRAYKMNPLAAEKLEAMMNPDSQEYNPDAYEEYVESLAQQTKSILGEESYREELEQMVNEKLAPIDREYHRSQGGQSPAYIPPIGIGGLEFFEGMKRPGMETDQYGQQHLPGRAIPNPDKARIEMPGASQGEVNATAPTMVTLTKGGKTASFPQEHVETLKGKGWAGV